MISDKEHQDLKKIAIQVRKDCLEMQQTAGFGHLGGAFSGIELMVYLYFKHMHLDFGGNLQEERDIFILSKGHASISYYSVLARRGFFPAEELKTYCRVGSRLQGYAKMDAAPGIEYSTGSLGQGLSFALGLALGYQKKSLKSPIYVLLGGSELQEGQVWEALLLQSYLQLNNLVIIIDSNNLQQDNFLHQGANSATIAEKLQPFGFYIQEIDGHNFGAIDQAFAGLSTAKGNVIIANTLLGKGVSFMENSIAWHTKKCTSTEFHAAMLELSRQEDANDE